MLYVRGLRSGLQDKPGYIPWPECPAKEEDLVYLRGASHVQGEQECPSGVLCRVAQGRSVSIMDTLCRAAPLRTHSLDDLAASPQIAHRALGSLC